MRKILALLLVLMMGVVFVAGCGGDTEAPADDPAVQEEVQGDVTDPVEEEDLQEEEPVVADEGEQEEVADDEGDQEEAPELEEE